MKRIPLIALLLLLSFLFSNGAPKYWVGPANGNWSDQANWSNTLNGSGGAALPGTMDSVIFYDNFGTSSFVYSLVHVDVSPTISALDIRHNVTLYTSTSLTLTILSSLTIAVAGVLKDSTSADVSFHVVLSGAGQSNSRVNGFWVFEGGVPVNRSAGRGADFISEPGSRLSVVALRLGPAPSTPFSPAGITFKNNTGFPSSDVSTLSFLAGTTFRLENNLDAAIPNATWRPDSILGVQDVTRKALIMITGKMGTLTHLAPVPAYRDIVVDLPVQTSDASLNLPDGTIIDGNLTISNTNNKTIFLLASNGPSSSVKVTIDLKTSSRVTSAGLFTMNVNTRVAMAYASALYPATSYILDLGFFNQSGGNFSLQDNNDASGTSLLVVKGGLSQSDGTFITNSSSTNPAAQFIVQMNGPAHFQPGPSGFDNNGQSISMKSGSIDNSNHKVTLQILYKVSQNDRPFYPGVDLRTPLVVGRLELLRGQLQTSEINMLTITDPSAQTAIQAEKADSSYVNGPLRRWTNSTSTYKFPTGPVGCFTCAGLSSSSITPGSAALSLYQAEYVPRSYDDLTVVSPLNGVSNTQYWNFTKIQGAEAAVQLLLKSPVPGAGFADALVAARYINGHWQAENGSVLTPGNATTGTVISQSLSELGAFTFGYGDAANFDNEKIKGLSYKYYEGSFDKLPDFTTLTPVKTGNSANLDLSVRRIDDGFAIVWEGYINIPTAGRYTFETLSDDGSRLYFNSFYSANSSATVDNDGTHPLRSATGSVDVPAAGRYPIAVSFFENYGLEGIQVFWSGPGMERQLIPDAAFGIPALSTGSGLNYKYYEGDFNTLPDFSTLLPVKTGKSANLDIGVRPANVNDHFAFVWEGYITIPAAGTYTFETISDDGSKLYFNSLYNTNESSLVNNDGVHPLQPAAGTILITAAGIYPIFITFFEKEGGEIMQAYWSGPGFERQLIPDVAFTSIKPAAPSGLIYTYYEGDFSTLPDFTSLTPLRTGRSPVIDIGIRPSGVTDHFAFIWKSYLKIDRGGTYNLEMISDDGSKLYLNLPYSKDAVPLLSNDGVHAPSSTNVNVSLAPGTYPITVTYFEKEGRETLELYWKGPGIERQLIPEAAFTQAQRLDILNPGLRYKFYEGAWSSLPNFNEVASVATGTSSNVDIGVRPSGTNDNFGFVWEGFITFPLPGIYTLETVSDDGSSIALGLPNNVVVSNDGLHALQSATGRVDVMAGMYRIFINYFENGGFEQIELYWTGPGLARQRIPNSAFTYAPSFFQGTIVTNPMEMKTTAEKDFTITKVYPNPFHNNLNLDFYNSASANEIDIKIYDINGRLIYLHNAHKMPTGINSLKVDLTNKRMANGVYFVKLIINGVMSKSIKLVKMKR